MVLAALSFLLMSVIMMLMDMGELHGNFDASRVITEVFVFFM